ncbi:unnamed protein product [Didymodactylos carnosus]|uniref:SH2 domain-containing protein n=1 Tax=Didymodactylos carnosus TaxID=1234261 RepID=A0A8S2I1X2_9BILA|nr:unnamed protein product [Didymodactylos carnosus]CAF3689730.1 unnamed protein product [Didymodactylos carnosus]
MSYTICSIQFDENLAEIVKENKASVISDGTDSLSEDFKSIQNSISSIHKTSSIILKSFAPQTLSITTSNSCIDENSPWFYNNITRQSVELALKVRSVGSFILRNSSSSPNSMVLSVRVPKYIKKSLVVHYLIDYDRDGCKLRGTKKLFTTLSALIVHHSIVTENLPVALDLRQYYPESSQSKEYSDYLT